MRVTHIGREGTLMVAHTHVGAQADEATSMAVVALIEAKTSLLELCEERLQTPKVAHAIRR